MWTITRAASYIMLACLALAACAPAPAVQVTYDAGALRFSGQRALDIETTFVQRFPDRASGRPNNALAAGWLREQLAALDLTCRMDNWEVINYSRLVPMQNVICELPGESPRQIVVVAHHDQSPDTIQGADNDGSGIAILLHLAEVLAAGGRPAYTLVFLAADGEEYGMLGTRRFVHTHPDPGQIVAAISLDNLGKALYDGLIMDARGQFRGYGALWLQRLAQASARQADQAWVPDIASPVDQVLGQAVPISFMDEGPLVAAGVPAFGFAGRVPPEAAQLHWDTYHNPDDTLEYQSADSLHRAGRAAEALIRQLLSMRSFPVESGPYLYLPGSEQVLRGPPLWAIFVAFVGVFFAAGVLTGGAHPSWRLGQGASLRAVPHFLGLWLPFVAAVLLLYLFVAVGLMEAFHLYPATAKDEPLFEPRWPAVILFLIGITIFLIGGRRLAARLTVQPPSFPAIRTLALWIVGLGGVYILIVNPFSLLFMLPLPAWLLIRGRDGAGRALDVALFALGGLVVYVLFYFFGFVILRNGLAVLWYLMMMFSIGTIGFPTAAAIAAILAAGLMLIVTPPGRNA